MKQKRKQKIGFIQLTGYLRSAEIQLFCHPDTDERLIQCIELSKAIAVDGSSVEIFTRLFNIPGAENSDYSRKEQQSEKSNARIIRLNCGPTDKFLPANKIWKYIPEFANNIANYISTRRLNLELFIANTPESAMVALLLKKKLKIPYVYNSFSFLFDSFNSKLTEKNIMPLLKRNNWHISYEFEKTVIKYADALVIPNYIQFEKLIENKFYSKNLAKTLNIQRINSGVFLENFENVSSTKSLKIAELSIKKQIDENRRELPAIVTDYKSKELSLENLNNILKLFSKSGELKNIANLVIITIDCAGEDSVSKINEIVNKFGLTGKICLIALKDYLNDIAGIYNYFKKSGGVYFNYSSEKYNIGGAMNAAAAGLPLVIKKNMRALDFTDFNRYGLMFSDLKQAEEALFYIFNTPNIYAQYSERSVKRIENNFLWRALSKKYSRLFESVNNAKHYMNTSNIIIPKILEKFTDEDETLLKNDFINIIFNNQN